MSAGQAGAKACFRASDKDYSSAAFPRANTLLVIDMNWKAKAYIALIVLGGLSTMIELPTYWQCDDKLPVRAGGDGATQHRRNASNVGACGGLSVFLPDQGEGSRPAGAGCIQYQQHRDRGKSHHTDF